MSIFHFFTGGMSVIQGSSLIPCIVHVTGSEKLISYLTKKFKSDTNFTVQKQTRQRVFPGKVNIFVVDLGDKPTTGRPLTTNDSPILYLTSSEDNLITDDDLLDHEAADSDNEASGSDSGSDDEASGSESGSDDDDEASGSESGSGDEDERKVAPSSGEKKLRSDARAIADHIKEMHTAHIKEELAPKIRYLVDLMLAKAYTRNVFRTSNKFRSEQERQMCLQGLDSVALEFIFPDIAKNMPPVKA